MNVLYLGDNAGTSAEYLKDVLVHLGHDVTHVDSSQSLTDWPGDFDVCIVSDYPAKHLAGAVLDALITRVKAGMRLIMLGGWDTFNGRGTNYYGHPLAELLPIELLATDDRRNVPQGLMLSAGDNVSSDLAWNEPPIICGYNAVGAVKNGIVRVWASLIHSNGTEIALGERLPLVVTANNSPVVVCMTDVAPHWCGGLVDWGKSRVTLPHVEVADSYIRFIQMLVEL